MEEYLELIVHTTLGIAKTLMKCIEAFLDNDIVLDIIETVLDIKNYCKKK